MNIQDLRTLLEYHYWARDRMLTAVERVPPELFRKELGSSFTTLQDTLVHVCSAEWAWHQRWVGISPKTQLPSSTFPDVPSVRAHWLETEKNVRTFLESAGETGVDLAISYKTLNGDDRVTPLWQMVQHLVNHASYHRGQITTLLRQLGQPAPESTDLIRFYWERK
ncbi:MAG: DinB family protein [Vicinamibacteria bacterium]